MIRLKSPDEIATMYKANQIVADVLMMLHDCVRPGMTTLEIDKLAADHTKQYGAVCAFKNYSIGVSQPFPANICVSLNNEIAHGIPSQKRIVRVGDIVSVDFGVVYDGFYGDSAITFPVGLVTSESIRLMDVTRESLDIGIAQMVPGKRLGDIGAVIQEYVKQAGCSIVRDFVGHGIGRNLHEDPQVPHWGTPNRGLRLRPGMVLAIEPMVNVGGPEISMRPDQWTAVTRDGSLSAHFEHTVAIQDDGPLVLSQRA